MKQEAHRQWLLAVCCCCCRMLRLPRVYLCCVPKRGYVCVRACVCACVRAFARLRACVRSPACVAFVFVLARLKLGDDPGNPETPHGF